MDMDLKSVEGPMIVPAMAPNAIGQAVAALQAGALIGLPTETVYGLAGDATSALAIAKIYAAKGRPRFNPLIIHVASLEEAQRFGDFSAAMERLANAFWPGPLTLVVEARRESPVAELARAGLSTIALRVPALPLTRAVIEACGRPLAAPSANRSGHVTATLAQHVADDLGQALALVLDDGPSKLGLESTILAEIGGKIMQLRAGSLPREAVEAVIGMPLGALVVGDGMPQAPGMLAKHYAPHARLRLHAIAPNAGEACLAFGPIPFDAHLAGPILNLSERGDVVEAAAHLFGHLRALDAMGAPSIAVMPIPNDGLGEAINDRLARAALGR